MDAVNDVNAINVLITVVFLVILAVPGFIFSKIKMLPEKASETLSVIVLYCCQPVLVITSFQSQAFNADVASNMLIVIGLVAVVHVVMIGIMCALTAGKGAEPKMKCLKYASIFSNCGFMGLPFLQALYPESGEIMMYGAVIISVFNVVNWTVGVLIMTGDKKQVSFKKIILNPVIISVVVGLIMFFTIPQPLTEIANGNQILDNILEKFMSSLMFISNMVTPLSMFVIGIKLSKINLKQLFMDKWAYVACFMKLIVMSAVAMLVVAFLPVSDTVKYVVFFLMSMPSATSTALFAVQFKGDSDFATVAVLLSTILTVASVPLMFMLFQLLL